MITSILIVTSRNEGVIRWLKTFITAMNMRTAFKWRKLTFFSLFLKFYFVENAFIICQNHQNTKLSCTTKIKNNENVLGRFSIKFAHKFFFSTLIFFLCVVIYSEYFKCFIWNELEKKNGYWNFFNLDIILPRPTVRRYCHQFFSTFSFDIWWLNDKFSGKKITELTSMLSLFMR